jgi:glycosyltransferase involved in cell wall biosynthesis
MSSPGDLFLNDLQKLMIVTTRVIHDIEKHPGDFWPTKYVIQRLLEAQRIILLSDFIFDRVDHPRKYKSSLSRKNISFGINKPECNLPGKYLLFIGRFKTYKNLELLEEIIEAIPEKTFVVAGEGSGIFADKVNVITIQKWLDDSEIEWLIKNAQVLLALYSEASQSGVVEQALFWRVPCLVSRNGGLPEQVIQQKLDEFIVEIEQKEEIINLLRRNLDLVGTEIPVYSPQETLFETIKKLN